MMQVKTENSLSRLLKKKSSDLLNIYFTAGYPSLNDTVEVLVELEKNGVDLIEVGIPYSDPLADGPTIQESGAQALKNGMSLEVLFGQLAEASVDVPIILMGYFNQLLQYGFERFCRACVEVGVCGLIVPDLPLLIFEQKYKGIADRYGLHFIFLVTPQTSEARIRKIDELSSAFIYMVSDASITGGTKSISDRQITYFNRIQKMKLQNPRLIGFGISDREAYQRACQYADGAIIGSAFIKALQQEGSIATKVNQFISTIR